MLTTLIEKEIRDLLGSTKFVVTFGVCVLLILLSFFMGATSYKTSRAQFEAAQTANLRQMEGLTDWLAVEDYRIFLPPQPLASLVSGISNDIGRSVEVTGRGELQAYGSRFNEEPLFAVFRFLDLEFIFLVVLSLMAILLGYDAISGEKETGTLRLTFANAISRSVYLLGKLLGLFIALCCALLLALGIGALLLPAMGVPLSGAEWLRLGLIVLTGLLYFGVFLTLSVFVSALTQRSSSSFMLLLTVWIVAVLIVPRASILLAGRAVEVPSVDQIAARKATFSSQLWKEFRASMSSFTSQSATDMDQTMKEFNRFLDSLNQDRDNRMDALASRLNEDRENRRRRQAEIAFALARTSPSTSLVLAATRLAGSSPELEGRYAEAAAAYQQSYAGFMFDKTGMNVGGGMVVRMTTDDGETPQPIDPTEIPVFTFQLEPPAAAVAAALPDIGLLALANLLFFTGAFVAFRRYDVR
jgi:ABC-type transport system involved in multi-copper enzyme maturation permease subunit